MMPKYMTIDVTVAPRKVGIWCDQCNLPSKVEFGIYWLRESGVSTIGTSLIRCTEGHQ